METQRWSPRDSWALKMNEIQEVFVTVPLYVPHDNLAFIPRFLPAYFVTPFGTTSDIAKRPLVRLDFQYIGDC